MRNCTGLNQILGSIHIYPTRAAANKYTAGQWEKAHAPVRMLRWVERFHRWHRRAGWLGGHSRPWSRLNWSAPDAPSGPPGDPVG